MEKQKNSSAPEISVVMAAHNEERYIASAIKSILEQTFSNWELIIIDDGSSDATSAILDQYRDYDRRIRVERNEVSQGLAACLNRGVSLARSDIIVRADADDLNLPTRFEEQLIYLKSHPEIHILGTGAFLIDEMNTILNEYYLPETHEEIRAIAYKNSCFFHPSVAIRRDLFSTIGMYDVSFKRAQDKELWIRGLSHGCLYANLRRPLIQYRVTARSLSWLIIYQTFYSLIRIGRYYQIQGWWLYGIAFLFRQVLVKFNLYKPKSLAR